MGCRGLTSSWALFVLLTGCATFGPRPAWAPAKKPHGYSKAFYFRDSSAVTVEVRMEGGASLRLEPGQQASAPLLVKLSRHSRDGFVFTLVRVGRDSVHVTCSTSEGKRCKLDHFPLPLMSAVSPTGSVLSASFGAGQPSGRPRRAKATGPFWMEWTERVKLDEYSMVSAPDIRGKALETTVKSFAVFRVRASFDWRDVVRHELYRAEERAWDEDGGEVRLAIYDTEKPVPAAAKFAGQWLTSAGALELRQRGRTVTGTLSDGEAPVRLRGWAVGDVALLSWTQESGKGQAIVMLGPDGQTFAGCRGRGKSDACEFEDTWLGKRAPTAPVPAPVDAPTDAAAEKAGDEAEQPPAAGEDASAGDAPEQPAVAPSPDAGTDAPSAAP